MKGGKRAEKEARKCGRVRDSYKKMEGKEARERKKEGMEGGKRKQKEERKCERVKYRKVEGRRRRKGKK